MNNSANTYFILIYIHVLVQRKRLKGRISLCFPSLSQAVIDELLPSKCVLVSVRVFTHSNSNVIIFTVNGQPLFFEHEGLLCPTGSS